MAKDILIITLILVLIGIVYQLFFNNPKLDTAKVDLNGTIYNLEVAKTIPQKTKGLMNRTSLPPQTGMIFVSDFDIHQAFWMKNTLIPLDMIFVTSNGTITNIITATPQPKIPDNQLQIYQSTSPAKYVIELNSGQAGKLNLHSGDVIKLPAL